MSATTARIAPMTDLTTTEITIALAIGLTVSCYAA